MEQLNIILSKRNYKDLPEFVNQTSVENLSSFGEQIGMEQRDSIWELVYHCFERSEMDHLDIMRLFYKTLTEETLDKMFSAWGPMPAHFHIWDHHL